MDPTTLPTEPLKFFVIQCFHFPFPGLGYALEYGDAYRWHPAGWTVLS